MKIMSVAAVEEKHTVTLYRNLFIRLLYFRDSREKADQPAIGTALFLAMADCQLISVVQNFTFGACFDASLAWKYALSG